MTAIATLLVVLTLSLLTVRVATVMLILTGLSLPLARFQARSAFTGCGYTTGESEQLVGHPVRRRIISTLMLLGNAGIVTTIGALMAGLFAGSSGEQVLVESVNADTGDVEMTLELVNTGFPLWVRLLFLGAGVASLWAVASSKYVERIVNRWTFKLLRNYTKIEVRDYANLMHLSGDYGISELRVGDTDWLADRPLKELRLTSEGVIVLGMNRRDGSYVGAPDAETTPRPGDVLIVYGTTERLGELDTRRRNAAGQLKHVEAVADQQARRAESKVLDTDDPVAKAEAARRKQNAELAREAVRRHVAEIEAEEEKDETPALDPRKGKPGDRGAPLHPAA